MFGASAAGTSCHGSPESGQKLGRHQLHSKDYETGASCITKRRMGRIQQKAQNGGSGDRLDFGQKYAKRMRKQQERTWKEWTVVQEIMLKVHGLS